MRIRPDGQRMSDDDPAFALFVFYLHAGLVEVLPQKWFTAAQYTNLNDTMAAMGMGRAFSGAADFSAMSPTGLSVQSVVQRDYLRVDEKGTEAAAVSGIDMYLTSAERRRQISLDHPFLFLIRDTKTGTILFAAQIQHP